MTAFILSPAPEWRDKVPSLSRQSYTGQFENPAYGRAFFGSYDSRADALAVAELAGLYPSTEVYGVGTVTIMIAPAAEFGGQVGGTLSARHNGARVSGLYVGVEGGL